ncbi:hypothetical protein [Jannaschia sp. CCS1]|uniref:hypothetical protein n=1 Tax=Jannaschia sp. (strain CCS1) TaxID=290400 RepID=UPI0002F59893|nr:hypothetical protein [Jannaschia sp. CCS1]
MLVIIALIAYVVGQVATVATLFATALITATRRHPLTVVPLLLAGLWIGGTVDFADLSDGPMRMDANGIIVGTGGGVPRALSNGSDGPAWWIASAAFVCFAVFTLWPKLPYLRPISIIGLVTLAITYAGFAAINAMY